jgi:hypothetical protein
LRAVREIFNSFCLLHTLKRFSRCSHRCANVSPSLPDPCCYRIVFASLPNPHSKKLAHRTCVPLSTLPHLAFSHACFLSSTNNHLHLLPYDTLDAKQHHRFTFPPPGHRENGTLPSLPIEFPPRQPHLNKHHYAAACSSCHISTCHVLILVSTGRLPHRRASLRVQGSLLSLRKSFPLLPYQTPHNHVTSRTALTPLRRTKMAMVQHPPPMTHPYTPNTDIHAQDKSPPKSWAPSCAPSARTPASLNSKT